MQNEDFAAVLAAVHTFVRKDVVAGRGGDRGILSGEGCADGLPTPSELANLSVALVRVELRDFLIAIVSGGVLSMVTPSTGIEVSRRL